MAAHLWISRQLVGATRARLRGPRRRHHLDLPSVSLCLLTPALRDLRLVAVCKPYSKFTHLHLVTVHIVDRSISQSTPTPASRCPLDDKTVLPLTTQQDLLDDGLSRSFLLSPTVIRSNLSSPVVSGDFLGPRTPRTPPLRRRSRLHFTALLTLLAEDDSDDIKTLAGISRTWPATKGGSSV